MRMRAMRRPAAQDDAEIVDRGQRRAGQRLHRAERQVGDVVDAVDRVAREALEQPVIQHRLGAGEPLLGGLEDEVHRAREIPRLGEVFRRAQQHRGVPVMAAGMHAVRCARAVGEVVGLLHRQRVHVRAQADRPVAAGRFAPAQDAHHPRAAEAAMHLDAPFRELGGDDFTGAVFLEADLGMRVEVLPPGGHFGLQLGQPGQRGHRAQAPTSIGGRNATPLGVAIQVCLT